MGTVLYASREWPVRDRLPSLEFCFTSCVLVSDMKSQLTSSELKNKRLKEVSIPVWLLFSSPWRTPKSTQQRGAHSTLHFWNPSTINHTLQYTIPCPTIPYRTIPYSVGQDGALAMPYHIIPYHTMPCHTLPYHTLSHTLPYHAIPCHTIPNAK